MEKKGKSLESIVALIQETLKNSPNTRVLKNHKIENKDGGKREFDVFIESNVSGYSINIAIECKDYKKPVPVKEIEAFNSKCNSFTKINKKIFISSSGFQAGAITSANNFGIELQVAEKLNTSAILNWIPISNITFQILEGGNSTLIIDQEDGEEFNFDIPIDVTLNCNGIQTNIDKIVNNILSSSQDFIRNLSLLIWLKLDNENKNLPFFVPWEEQFTETHTLKLDNKTYSVIGIQLNLRCIYETTPITVKEIRELKDIDGSVKAETLTIESSNEITTSFVKTPDNNTTVHISKDGNSKQLKLLAVYDSKTNRLDIKK